MSETVNTPAQSSESAVPLTPEQPLLRKIKVGGKEIQVPIEELERDYGKGRAADDKFREAKKILDEGVQLKNFYSQKKLESLFAAGWTEQELEQQAAEWLVEKAKRDSMTPHQKAVLEQQKEYERLKKGEEDRIKNEKEKVEKDLREREAQLYQTAFLSEVAKADKDTWLDLNDPIILSAIINNITVAHNKYGIDMSVKESVKALEEKSGKRGPAKKNFLRKLIKDTIIGIDDNDLEAFLEKGVKGIREKSVEAFKKNESPFSKQMPKMQTQTPEEKQKHDLKYHRDLRMGRIKPK